MPVRLTTGITNVLNNVNPALLLPTDTYHYFTYSGSLTTPGGGLLVLPLICKGLKWFVLRPDKAKQQAVHRI